MSRTGLVDILARLNERIFDEQERDPQDQLTLTLLKMARADIMAARARIQARETVQWRDEAKSA